MSWDEYRNNYIRKQEEADGWQAFHTKFMQLANEEETNPRAIREDRLLRAHCDYHKHPEIWGEKGKPEQGFFCLLKEPETGLWIVCDGVSENFQERFRALAARAGVTLGCPKDTDAEDFWLHRLYLDLLENNSDQLFAASKKGGMIRRVCVASATFCARLERKAFEQSEPGNSTGEARLSSRGQNSANASSDAQSEPNKHAATEQGAKRLRPTVNSPIAARKMENHLESRAIGLTDFAATVGTTDRTLRSFRKTGKVRRDILESIARHMGTTKEALLGPE